jgi:hypothetical protein
MIPNSNVVCKPTKQADETEDLAVARFIRFLKRISLKESLAAISDPRQQAKCEYSNHSLLLWALSVFFFRQESKNSFQTTLESMPHYKKESIFKYLDIDVDSVPHSSVVDDYLGRIDPKEINDLLLKLFHWCQKNKLFYNHAETLLPNNNYHLGVDGFWVHKYDIPHVIDEHGKNCCPYCLPRTSNKGKPEEKTYWVHAFVTFVLIFPGGFQLPIYVYPLKAAQIDASKNDKELKQECELTAFYAVLPELRQKLGRIHLTILLDSLYANEPVIRLIEMLNMFYFIVRQEESLKSVGRKCDELEGTELYQKFYQKKRIVKLKNGGEIEQKVKWFNQVTVGKETFTNVLKFEEVIKDKEGSVVETYKNEWLSEEKINENNCFNLAERARMRFGGHEDTHNSLKNRGFDAKHDYARTDPNKMLIWKLLMFVAFGVMELFSFTSLAREAKGTRSWMKFAKDLLQQLVEILWSTICASESIQKQKIQFRFMFLNPDT